MQVIKALKKREGSKQEKLNEEARERSTGKKITCTWQLPLFNLLVECILEHLSASGSSGIKPQPITKVVRNCIPLVDYDDGGIENTRLRCGG